ncbi:MAG: GxxExxY protein [Bacteroidia bacterium]
MNEQNYNHSDITGIVIKAYYAVYNRLGYGFLERVYHNAMLIELAKYDLNAKSEFPIEVFYEGKKVGMYFADLIINDCVIVELKASKTLELAHEAQLTNYLRATFVEVGLLLNFGKSAEFKRKVHSMAYKERDLYQERKAA